MPTSSPPRRQDFQNAVSILQTIISKNGFGVIGQNTFPELDENNNVDDHISNGLIFVTGLSKFANTWGSYYGIKQIRFSQNFWRTLLMGCTRNTSQTNKIYSTDPIQYTFQLRWHIPHLPSPSDVTHSNTSTHLD